MSLERDPELRKPRDFIFSLFECAKVWDPQLQLYFWVSGHLAAATGPCVLLPLREQSFLFWRASGLKFILTVFIYFVLAEKPMRLVFCNIRNARKYINFLEGWHLSVVLPVNTLNPSLCISHSLLLSFPYILKVTFSTPYILIALIICLSYSPT